MDNQRNNKLDYLRAGSIFLVIGAHLHDVGASGLVGRVYEVWKSIGPFGVHLFFLISGYLIGGLLLNELTKYGRIDVARFLIRRGFKIYPAYYVFLTYWVVYPALKSVPDFDQARILLSENFFEIIPNLFFVQNYFGTNPIAHTWSLAVEEHFYILLPLVIVFAIRLRIRDQVLGWIPVLMLVCLGLRVLAVSQGVELRSLLWWSHLHIDALFMGVWLAFRVRNPTRMIRYVTRHGGIVLMAGVILVSCVRLLPLPATFGLTIGFTLTYIAACSILIGSLNFNWHQNKEAPSKLVSILGPLTALIGRNSYSIYLWHVAAIGFAERMTKKIIDGYVESANIIWLLNATSAVLVSVVVGIGFGYLIEWPFVKLRDKLFPSRAKALPLNEVASEDARGCAIK